MRRTDRPDPPQAVIDLGAGVARRGCVSGPPLENVRHGWFLPIWSFGRAHWYDHQVRDKVRELRRLCDGEVSRAADLLEPGTWPSCRRCRAMIVGVRNGMSR